MKKQSVHSIGEHDDWAHEVAKFLTSEEPIATIKQRLKQMEARKSKPVEKSGALPKTDSSKEPEAASKQLHQQKGE